MQHYVEYCSECNKLIGQCRCMNCDKQVVYGICSEECNNNWHKRLKICYYFEGGTCGHPNLNVGETSENYCNNCKERKLL
jgi:hypothetical protein